jgi:hypothetical protein
MKITKQEIKELEPCTSGYEWYLENFPADENDLKDIFVKLIEDEQYSYARWFLNNCKKIELKVKINLAVFSAELVLPIYTKRYPNDNRVSDCILATKDFILGKINREELLKKRNTAAAAYAAAADADDAAAYAAYAAAYAAADAAAYAAYAADAAADAAAYAAYAAAYAAYARKNTWLNIINKLFDMVNNENNQKQNL